MRKEAIRLKRCVLCASYGAGMALTTDYLDKLRGILSERDSGVENDGDFVIAVDGGLHLAEKLSLEVDYLIGDLDSIDLESEGFLKLPKSKILKLPVEKDDTDSMFAARFIVERGFKEVLFFGGIGGRIDHTLANLAVLNYLTFAGLKATMVDEFSVVKMFKPGRYPFKKGAYRSDTFSLIPYGGAVEGVNIHGGYYPLKNATLRVDFPVGVSNKYKDEFVEIEFTKGSLIIIFSNS